MIGRILRSADFERVLVPALTHWNHPGFFGYFAISSSASAVLAEFLSAALNQQAMLWRTSPAATELEEVSLGWLRELLGLPTSFDDAREQVVYEMAIALTNGRWVPRGLYERAVKALGHVSITDVITLMGHYSSVAMTLAFYDVPDGAPGLKR